MLRGEGPALAVQAGRQTWWPRSPLGAARTLDPGHRNKGVCQAGVLRPLLGGTRNPEEKWCAWPTSRAETPRRPSEGGPEVERRLCAIQEPKTALTNTPVLSKWILPSTLI